MLAKSSLSSGNSETEFISLSHKYPNRVLVAYPIFPKGDTIHK